jgi:hypothetical protein
MNLFKAIFGKPKPALKVLSTVLAAEKLKKPPAKEEAVSKIGKFEFAGSLLDSLVSSFKCNG